MNSEPILLTIICKHKSLYRLLPSKKYYRLSAACILILKAIIICDTADSFAPV
jgi:hypothetical protein